VRNFLTNHSCLPLANEESPGKPGDFSHFKDCYINSPEDGYCFWAYLARKSDSNGLMQPLSQQQIATLLGLSNSKVQTLYKESMEKIKSSEEFQDFLKEFLS
jgi:hypothetical protein